MENRVVKTFVDIGSYKLKAIVSELIKTEDKETLKILSYDEVYSDGIEKGKIVDKEKFAKTLSNLINKINDKLDMEIHSIIVGLSIANFKSDTIDIAIKFEDETVVTSEHMEELIQRAKERLLKNSEMIIQSEIYNIKLDNTKIVKNPIDSVVDEIRARVHLIYTEKETINILQESLSLAGLELEKVLINIKALAKAVLTNEEKKRGVALVDIGDEIIEICIYKQGKLIFMSTIGVGGRNFATDLTWLDEIKEREDKFKLAYEIIDKYRRNHIVSGHIKYDEQREKIKYEVVENIISFRKKDIVDNINKTLEESGFINQISKGIVLTGGVIQDPIINVDDLIEEIQVQTKLFTKVVIPQNYFSGIKEIRSSMSAVLGMMYIIMQKESEKLEKLKEVDEEGNYVFQEEGRNIKALQESDKTKDNEEEKKEKKEFGSGFLKWWNDFI